MAAAETASAGALVPVAVVWCRQVDNEAESPGYTTIPEEFPGRRETVESIRVVGNLTINIADTHDYWDPDPSQPLSFYPNLFLYPAANGRYTCVGRMFLSTEDRPRLGMKTLVFETAPLVAGGEFGSAVLRAYATMSGRTDTAKPAAEPDPFVYQTVGEGFLFHRGTTEPVVVVASEAWEAAGQAVLELVRVLPTSLVALGAFLVFPYFLPEAKVNLHEFTEQFPLALAVMRVPRGEAQGDRHAKRLQSWESAPVTLRDLTRASRGREALPLVLQYAREHQDTKIREVTRRVDAVEAPRLESLLHDAERQGGRDRRKEMWRIGTAMETAALLLTRPKGRSVPMTGEAAKRANEYLQARPSETVVLPPEPMPTLPRAPSVPVTGPLGGQHPPWLHKPSEVTLPPSGPSAVPVSTSEDPSTLPAGAVPPSPTGPGLSSLPTSSGELEALLKNEIDRRFAELVKSSPASSEAGDANARFAGAMRELESKWTALLDARVREASEASTRAVTGVQTDLTSRLAAIEARPVVSPSDVAAEAEQRVQGTTETKIQALEEKVHGTTEAKIQALAEQVQSATEARVEALAEKLQTTTDERFQALAEKVQGATDTRFRALEEKVEGSARESGEMWASRLRDELRQSVDELRAQATHDEEEMRAALVAQIDLELREAQEQGTVLREEIEARVRDALKERLTEADQRHAKELRDLEQRLGLLVDGRTKDVETRLQAAVTAASADAREQFAAVGKERSTESEQRRGKELRELEQRVGLLVDGRTRELEARLQATIAASNAAAREQVATVGKERSVESDQRRVKELRDLEQRVGLLIDGRTKDLETRLQAAISASTTDVRDKLTAAQEARVAQAEKRWSVDGEARFAQRAESQTQALAGLQVRLQSYFEQKLRENQEREREKYVELLARLKAEVDQSLTKTIDSSKFDAVIRERVARGLEAAREQQEKAIEAAVGDAEVRLSSQQEEGVVRLERLEAKIQTRETDLLRIEQTLRHEVDDLDRRIQVVADRALPLVRRTWLRVSELEKEGPGAAETETHLKEFRREMARELRRVEGELLEQTSDLRDRLEATLASQGRIWLNLLKQLQSASEGLVRADVATAVRPRGHAADHAADHEETLDELLDENLRDASGYPSFASDPPNPLDPRPPPETELEEAETRRRPRRA
jgi:hypothetical protein